MLNQPNCTLYFHPFLRNSLNYGLPLFIPHQPCPFHGRSQQVFTCTITTNHFNLNHTKVIGNWGRKVSLFKDNYFLFFLFLDVAINAPFLSAWHDLIVNGRSPVTIPHPLNEIPGKVDVQVKVTHGGQDYFSLELVRGRAMMISWHNMAAWPIYITIFMFSFSFRKKN